MMVGVIISIHLVEVLIMAARITQRGLALLPQTQTPQA